MTPNPGQAYFPVILQILIAAAVAGAMIGFSFLLGKKVKNRVKDAPYECGIEATGDASKSFSVKFYLVGMLFILFDIEAIFLYPWVVVFKDLNRQQRMFPLFEMLVFVIFILCGFFYIWKMGVLDWSGDSELRASQKRKS
jgi:NADH-quinone oxidoreductase subunit A